MYSYSKLKGRIVEKYGSQEAFAKAINRSTVYVSNKITGKTKFNQSSIELWAQALEIPTHEFATYFFT